MKRARPTSLTTLLVCFLATTVVSSCETSFDPFVESDLTYTILGFLDTDADTQFVRIVPLRQVVDRGGPDPIDADVRTTDLETGLTVTWQDSIIHFADSSYGHVYWAPFSALPEHRYKIEVKRSDGAMTSAETLVPPLPGNPDSVYGAANESATFAPTFWPGVTNVIDADIRYYANEFSCLGTAPPPPPETARLVFVRYTGFNRGSPLDDNTWRFEMHLMDDREIVNDVLGLASSAQCVVIYKMLVRLATPSDDWKPPGGVWDQEVLIQPGTFSNVTGGLGWFGSTARTTVSYILSPIALKGLNYDYYPYPQ